MVARLEEVAAAAGVSVATASRALNNRPGVSEDARRRVRTAIDRLGYQRPEQLQPRRLGLIGVVIAELENPIFPVFAQAIEQALPSFGYSAFLATRQLGAVAEQTSIEQLREHGVAGLVFVSGIHSDTGADLEHYFRLREQGVPLALINGPIDGLDATAVATDDAAAVAVAVRHLRSLGHRRLALLNGSHRYTPAARKSAGFRAALDALSDLEGQEFVGDYSVEWARMAASEAAIGGATGLVAASDLVALGAVQGVREAGLDVPADVSVVGFDGAPIMAFTDPPLTTLRQPVPQLASAAVRGLIEEIEGEPRPRTELLFSAELVLGGSTDAAPGG